MGLARSGRHEPTSGGSFFEIEIWTRLDSRMSENIENPSLPLDVAAPDENGLPSFERRGSRNCWGAFCFGRPRATLPWYGLFQTNDGKGARRGVTRHCGKTATCA